MIELMMVGLILSLIAGGLFSVYFNIVNTYYNAQQDVLLQAEGERILDLIANGGYFGGERIYGANSIYFDSSDSDSLLVGNSETSSLFDDEDYKIAFAIDQDATNRRYAVFYIDFSATGPTSKLYFKLYEGSSEKYSVLLSDNLLMRKTGTDENDYGNYERTWLKTQLLPSSGSDYYSGVRVSFYLADLTQPVAYNYRLNRKLTTPVESDDQKKSYLAGIPYPVYFSRTIYFPNRIN